MNERPRAAQRAERPVDVDTDNLARGRLQFLLPTLFLGGAGFLVVVSLFLPYARIEVGSRAVENPLVLEVYLDHLAGDVAGAEALAPELLREPRPSREVLERSLSLAAIVMLVLLGVAAIYVHNQWAALLCLPAMAFPAVFLGDFRSWVAALAATRPVADGTVAIESSLASGFALAVVAALSVAIGLLFHRRAYRTLAGPRE